MSKNKLNVEINGTQLVLTREFDAPREKVFAAHTDCRHLMKWWGTRTFPLTYCNMDFRVGGRWHYRMTGPEGMESWGLSEYKEIKEPELLVYTDSFSDKDGNINTAFPSTTIRTEFIDQGGRTMIRTTANYGSAEDIQKLVDMGMIAGITETMEMLEEYLATQQ